jgi:adenylylsulfate kinase-like enzyme
MSNSDELVKEEAIKFAKANKKAIATSFTDVTKYKPEQFPISVFMAGSPGAGKTESAKALIQSLTGGDSVLRIDADDMRSQFKSYNGINSSLFQGATSILA